jgi:hypothetical protein
MVYGIWYMVYGMWLLSLLGSLEINLTLSPLDS